MTTSQDAQWLDLQGLLDLESLLDPDSPSPPMAQEERRRRAQEARKAQVLQYQLREEEGADRRGPSGRGKEDGRRTRKGRVKTVGFHVRDKLRDAVMRSDQIEGEPLFSSSFCGAQLFHGSLELSCWPH